MQTAGGRCDAAGPPQALAGLCRRGFPQLVAPLLLENEQYTVAVMRSLASRFRPLPTPSAVLLNR